MAAQKVGDRIISKRPDGHYDVLRIEDARQPIHEAVGTLEEARQRARADLPEGGQIWYRDHRDAADHLEPL